MARRHLDMGVPYFIDREFEELASARGLRVERGPPPPSPRPERVVCVQSLPLAQRRAAREALAAAEGGCGGLKSNIAWPAGGG